MSRNVGKIKKWLGKNWSSQETKSRKKRYQVSGEGKIHCKKYFAVQTMNSPDAKLNTSCSVSIPNILFTRRRLEMRKHHLILVSQTRDWRVSIKRSWGDRRDGSSNLFKVNSMPGWFEAEQRKDDWKWKKLHWGMRRESGQKRWVIFWVTDFFDDPCLNCWKTTLNPLKGYTLVLRDRILLTLDFCHQKSWQRELCPSSSS